MTKTVTHNDTVCMRYWYIRSYYDTCPLSPPPGAYTRYSAAGCLNASSTVTYGDNYPDWEYRIARLQNATTTLVGTKRHIERGWCQFEFKTPKTQACWQSTVKSRLIVQGYGYCLRNTIPSYPTSDASALALNEAKTKISKKIKDWQTEFNSQTFIGELGESIRMIRSPLSGLQKGIVSYLNQSKRAAARWRKVADRLSNISELWLEYSFGWKPLISDLQKGVSAGMKIIEGDFHEHRLFRAKGEIETQEGFIDKESYAASLWQRDSYTLKEQVILTACVSREITKTGNLTLPEMARYWGFDWQSFVPTVWELIPYSFLVDYFTNIGDIVNAMSINTSRVKWVSQTIRNQRTITVTKVWNKRPDLYETVGIYFTPPSYTITKVTRVPLDTVFFSFVPDFQTQIPGANSAKWLNMAALAGAHATALKSLRSPSKKATSRQKPEEMREQLRSLKTIPKPDAPPPQFRFPIDSVPRR